MLLGTFLGVQCLRLCLLIQGVWVQSLVGELRSHMPLGQNTKTWNRSNIVIKSMKSLKMVHIKKKIFKKKDALVIQSIAFGFNHHSNSIIKQEATLESACDMGDPGLIPGLRRSLGEGNGNPLQYTCLENSTDRGVKQSYSPWGHIESDTTD